LAVVIGNASCISAVIIHFPNGSRAGHWSGEYLRCCLGYADEDSEGNLLLTGEERAERADRRAEQLAAKLRELGINPDNI
jgi:non-ribosomal peptide synthetase component E (peptide arylation enzyme)